MGRPRVKPKLTSRDYEAASVRTGISEIKLKDRVRNKGLSMEEAIKMGDSNPVNHDFQVVGMKWQGVRLVGGSK